jgi:hypothetical protein
MNAFTKVFNIIKPQYLKSHAELNEENKKSLAAAKKEKEKSLKKEHDNVYTRNINYSF